MTTEASPATELLDPTAGAADTASTVVDTVLDANPPSSSGDTPTTDANEAPRSLLDVVKSVVKPEVVAPAAPSATTGQEKPAVDAEKPAEGEAKPDADLPFHNHPRWKEMIAQRDSFKPDAENYRQITSYMEANGLSTAEVAEGFQVMANLKSGSPAVLEQARGWFAERLAALDAHLGHTLPADLQQKVNDGLIDEELAREYARTRASATILEGQNTARTERQAQDRQADEVTAATTAMTTAVNDWEIRTKAADPDYATKAPLVEAQARAIVQRTGRPPANAEEGIALAEAAYAEVNRLLKPLAPKPRPITPAPAGMSTRVSEVPKTLKEAVRLALKR